MRSTSTRSVAIAPAITSSESRSVRGRVEDRLLVFLEIAVVGEREALQHREQRHQVPDRAAGLAAHQLGHVGVLLLRHQARAGGVGVGELDEAELRRRPEHQLLGQAREVHHRDRGRRQELERRVARGDGVHAVAGGRVEAERPGGLFAVERQRGAGQRAGAERAQTAAGRRGRGSASRRARASRRRRASGARAAPAARAGGACSRAAPCRGARGRAPSAPGAARAGPRCAAAPASRR